MFATIRTLLIAVLLTTSALARTQAPPPWTLDAVLEPTGLPGVAADEFFVGFGAGVALGPPDWLAVSASDADCANPAQPGGVIENAGRIYFFQRMAQGWQFRQSLCAAEPRYLGYYGNRMRASGPWLAVPDPGFTAHGTRTGRVELLRFDAGTQRWSRHSVFTGTGDDHLGSAVAIDGELLVAGEAGWQGNLGRVRTWQLNDDHWEEQATFAPQGIVAGARYGNDLSLYVHRCPGAGCIPKADLAVRAGDRVHLAVRNGATWQATQTLAPPDTGQNTVLRDIAVGRNLLAFGYRVRPDGFGFNCPEAAVRVYRRDGSGGFVLSEDLCRPTHGLDTFGSNLLLPRDSNELLVASPDLTAFGSMLPALPASVDSFDTAMSLQPLGSVQELSLAPWELGTWYVYHDYFGASMAQSGSTLAVGAPWAHYYWMSRGIGYVAMYRR